MFVPLSGLIGWRFSRARRSSKMAKFISMSSSIGIAIGVAVLIIGLSAMNGFESELRHRVLGVIPNAELSAANPPLRQSSKLAEYAESSSPNILAATPVVVVNAILSHDTVFKGVTVRGIDPSIEGTVTGADEFISGAGLKLLSADVKHRNIIIGAQIAEKMNVKIGDSIELISASADAGGAIRAPVGRMFQVGGILKIGGQIDNMLAYIHIDAARDIAGLKADEAHLLELKVSDLFDAQQQAYESARSILSYQGTSFYVRSWTRSMGHLYRDIQMIRSILYLSLVLIVTVACFNIVSNLIMITSEKRSEVAILLSMGINGRTIFKAFLILGAISGSIGVVVGTILGVVASEFLTSIVTCLQSLFSFQLLNSHNYFINYVPSEMHVTDILLVDLVAIAISLAASSIPSLFANRVSPAQELSGK